MVIFRLSFGLKQGSVLLSFSLSLVCSVEP